MKSMKTLVAAAIALAMVGSALAQGAGPNGQGGRRGGPGGPGGPGGRRGGMMNMDGPILAKLNLNAGQKAKVKALKEKTATDMKAAFEKNKGDRAAMRDALMPIMKNYRDTMEKVLTPAQQKQYKTLVKEMRDKMMKERGGRRGAPGTPPPTN